jgi:DNA replication initiation complex subunit (GINS family)
VPLEELRVSLLTERKSGGVTSLPPDLFEKTYNEILALQTQVYATEDPFSQESEMLIERVSSIKVTIEEIFSIRSSKIVSLAQSHAEGSFIDRQELRMLHPHELAMFNQIVAAIRVCRSALIELKPPQDLGVNSDNPPITLQRSALTIPSNVQSARQTESFSAESKMKTELSANLHVAHIDREALYDKSSSLSSQECGADHNFNISESLNVPYLRDSSETASPSTYQTPAEESFSKQTAFSPFNGKNNENMGQNIQNIADILLDSKMYSLVLVISEMDPFMGVDGHVYEIQRDDIITLPRKNANVLAERNIVLNIKAN